MPVINYLCFYMLTIHFLGTGTSQGVPIIGSNHPVCLSNNEKDKRLRVSVLLEWEQYRFVIDCGPDFRAQMLRVDCDHLDGVLFTHEHADHTAGLDDIRPFYFKQGNIPFYAHARVIENLKKRFEYILSDENKYPGAPSVHLNEISETLFTIGNKEVIPIPVLHNQLMVLGFRIDDFAYLTDVKTIPEPSQEKLKNLDVLVLNCLRIEPHASHLNLEEALQLVEQLQPKRTYFTHISHLLGFHDEVSQSLPENVFLAYDTLTITSF